MKSPRAGTRRPRRFVCGVRDVTGLLSEFEAVRVAIRSEAAQIWTGDLVSWTRVASMAWRRRNTSKRAQVWIKQTDAKGNVYYFNQDTLESAWFPPCMVCMRLSPKCVFPAKMRVKTACSTATSA